jgi:hypothetical protein
VFKTQVLVPTFRIKDPEEQKKARQETAYKRAFAYLQIPLARDTMQQAVNSCITRYFAGVGAHLPHQGP